MHNERFAMTAKKISIRLVELGHHEEALRMLPDAVQVFRTLAAERPAEFSQHLVTSLAVLVVVLKRLGYEYLEVEQEAIAMVDHLGGLEEVHAETRRWL